MFCVVVPPVVLPKSKYAVFPLPDKSVLTTAVMNIFDVLNLGVILTVSPNCAKLVDVVVSLSRKPMEKSTGAGRLFVAKNRAGRDGLMFPIRIDTSMSKIEVLDDVREMSIIDAIERDNSGTKDMLKSKWKEITGN